MSPQVSWANRILFLLIAWTLPCLTRVAAQTWCGKNYRKDQPITPPEGAFETLEELSAPQLAFQCAPRMHIYLESDDCDAASIILDTLVTFTRLRYSWPLPDSFDTLDPSNFSLHVDIGEERSSFSNVLFNATNIEIPVSLCSLQPRLEPYAVRYEIKEQGFNVVHPVPPFGDQAVFEAMLDYLDDIGLYLIVHVHSSYRDLEEVAREVKAIRHRKSLLLWYTADEPDGHGHPFDAARKAYEVVNNLDQYHPVSIALNCADYFFEEYTSGADIIMHDVYSFGNNVTFSSKYDTPCTTDFGCCGCDNCIGNLEDTSKRLDDASRRLKVMGWEKTKFNWAVPQAFGGEEFWARPPTGKEWLAQTLLSINHGARGVIPWIDPTPVDIKHCASRLALTLPRIATFLFDENVIFKHFTYGRIDTGTWTKGHETLFVAINLDDEYAAEYDFLGRQQRQSLKWLINEGVSNNTMGHLSFEPSASAIFVTFRIRTAHSNERSEASGDVRLVEHDEL
ncbi:hypothetical protein JR316_0013073 [Psilocybe cubensis]|uniref:Uncharacterized protein n=1 Tax=Psilocybe cubensis TaxID=181762 RepID=A0ACB8GFX1_PSICU|nr:hypothetical protein JR316_0013073 [Psilocybe cubensis]KAH9474610.1 hypothetical protein JR316_0013073 [Psilocybe cubensis]